MAVWNIQLKRHFKIFILTAVHCVLPLWLSGTRYTQVIVSLFLPLHWRKKKFKKCVFIHSRLLSTIKAKELRSSSELSKQTKLCPAGWRGGKANLAIEEKFKWDKVRNWCSPFPRMLWDYIWNSILLFYTCSNHSVILSRKWISED